MHGQSPTAKSDLTPSVDGMKDEKPRARPQRLNDSGRLFCFPSAQPRRRSQVHSQLLPTKSCTSCGSETQKVLIGASCTSTPSSPLERNPNRLTLRHLQEAKVQHAQVQSRPGSGDSHTDTELFTPSLFIDDSLQTENISRCCGNNKEQSSFLCLYKASSLRRVSKHRNE